ASAQCGCSHFPLSLTLTPIQKWRKSFYSMMLNLLLLLPSLTAMAWKTQPIKCNIQDRIPIDHKYFQSGDLIIGGMTSFVFITRDERNFEKDPHHSITITVSMCSKSCLPGYFKKKQEDKPFCCYNCLPCPKEKMSSQEGETLNYTSFVKLGLIFIKMILILLLLLLPYMTCKSQSIKCSIQDPIPIDHKYFQQGDLIIGAITSFVFTTRNTESFEEDPHHSLASES
ncbi:hypothetical protein E2320_003005, partial [Naja naja]